MKSFTYKECIRCSDTSLASDDDKDHICNSCYMYEQGYNEATLEVIRTRKNTLLEAAEKFKQFHQERMSHASRFKETDPRRSIISGKGSEALRCQHWCERQALKCDIELGETND